MAKAVPEQNITQENVTSDIPAQIKRVSHYPNHDNYYHESQHYNSDQSDHHKPTIIKKTFHIPVFVERNKPNPTEKCIQNPMKLLIPYSYPMEKLTPQFYKVYIKVPTSVLQMFPVEKIIPVPLRTPYIQPMLALFARFPMKSIEKAGPIAFQTQRPYPIPIGKHILSPFKIEQYKFSEENNYNPEQSKLEELQEVTKEDPISFTPNQFKQEFYQIFKQHKKPEKTSDNEPKYYVTEPNFAKKQFYPEYILQDFENTNGKQITETATPNSNSNSEHFETLIPKSVYDKPNNEYHQHLTENFKVEEDYDEKLSKYI